jgi:hypothetical protein
VGLRGRKQQGSVEYYIMRSFMIPYVLLTKYDLYYQIREDEMGGACAVDDFGVELEGNLCL